MNALVFRALAPSLALLALAAASVLAQGDIPTSTSSPQYTPQTGKVILPGSAASAGRIITDRAKYRPGQPVHISFVVTNTTNKPVVYNFSTGRQYDITLVDAKGRTVWQSSRGVMFTQQLTRLSLKPGQHKTYALVWNGHPFGNHRLAPGVYTLNARMTSEDRPAVTGGVVVNTDRDPNNMGVPTKTPTETGAVRQVDVNPPVTATTTIVIGGSR